MRQLYMLSIDHRSFTSAERSIFELDNDLSDILDIYMIYVLNIHGSIILFTCNRIEIYYESDINYNDQIIERWCILKGGVGTSLSKKITRIAGNEDSIEHLLQLSLGIKSAILGDDQVLSQLKKAFETSRCKRQLSTLLERAYQTIMRFNKKVCKETNFKKKTAISLAYHSLKSIYNKVPKQELSSKKLLIIGAGDLAAQIVKYLPKFDIGHTYIMNRTATKAKNLTEGTSINVVPFKKINACSYDIIISCIDQGKEMIDNDIELDYYIDLSAYGCHQVDFKCHHTTLIKLQTKISITNKNRISSLNQIRTLIDTSTKEYMMW